MSVSQRRRNGNKAEMGTMWSMLLDRNFISKIVRWAYFYIYPTACSRPHEIASFFLELSWSFVIIPSGLWQARGRCTDDGVTCPLSRQQCLRLGDNNPYFITIFIVSIDTGLVFQETHRQTGRLMIDKQTTNMELQNN